MELKELIAVVSEVAGALQVPMDLEPALELITASAVDAIPCIDHASISVTTKHGRIETHASTDAVAVQADELQYQLRQGPCYEAVLSDPVVQVDDLASDPRWPAYGPKAASLGLGSQLAYQFRADPHVRGALNLYANKPHEIDVDARMLGAMFARLVAIAMGWGRQDESLREALATREQIGQAMGIVMERYHLDGDRAFAFLVRVSQAGNVKLRDVARAVIADTAGHAEEPPGGSYVVRRDEAASYDEPVRGSGGRRRF
ncbi:GAF and ANTAR domain-containing protein [Kribbella sp. CA-253562]|uniref:GAF and ANTAR domain-containing protein n=1 Tax=Kribbella sp. CA-253562 TaxID=3239942 RepID=UPI003D8A19AC